MSIGVNFQTLHYQRGLKIREPFFRGRDNIDKLAKTCEVVGLPDLYDYCEKYDISLSNDLQNAISRKRQNSRRKWVTMCAPGCPTPSSDGLYLLDRLLIYDHASCTTPFCRGSHATLLF